MASATSSAVRPKIAWPHQTRVLADISTQREKGTKAMVVASATGTGKSWIMYELLREADRDHVPTVVYCNRRLLFDQLAAGMYDSGISYGARAAGHMTKLKRDIQLAMIQTERSRVLQDGMREAHDAQLVLVDEAHIMANGAALTMIKAHLEAGATVIGFSATPVDVGHIYHHMIHGAGVSEGRECGALLPAKCFGPDMPSKRFIRRMKAGAEVIDGKWQTIWLKSIFGRVIEHWRLYNPEGRPTILFAPGVRESMWFAKKLSRCGIKAAHIDSKGVWVDGAWHPGDARRQEVLQRIAAGDLQVLSNRFVLKEAVNIPELYHCILATKFGSETTYIQAVGRVLRNHESLPDHILIQDHGANLLYFGSPNEDRHWQLSDTADARDYVRRQQMTEGAISEPYTCPRCFAIRRNPGVCQNCGLTVTTRVRRVVEAPGSLREVTGKMFKKPAMAGDKFIELWKRVYWSHRKKGKTFRQAFTAFGYRMRQAHGGFASPNPDWPFMPTRVSDELRRVKDVHVSELIPEKETANVFFESGQPAEANHRP